MISAIHINRSMNPLKHCSLVVLVQYMQRYLSYPHTYVVAIPLLLQAVAILQ